MDWKLIVIMPSKSELSEQLKGDICTIAQRKQLQFKESEALASLRSKTLVPVVAFVSVVTDDFSLVFC